MRAYFSSNEAKSFLPLGFYGVVTLIKSVGDKHYQTLGQKLIFDLSPKNLDKKTKLC
jgi:hypothetical protein